MLKPALKRRHWTTGEIQKLRLLAVMRVPVHQIARELDRTERTVRTKASLLGLARDWRWRQRAYY
jgi:hypothetical protein